MPNRRIKPTSVKSAAFAINIKAVSIVDTAKSQAESSHDQYYKGVKLYADHTNSRLKLLDYSCITVEVLMDIIRLAGEKKLGKIISNCRIPLLKPFKIVSAASADMDYTNLNAEITDCATYPEYRGQGLLSNLVYSLEQDLTQKGFYTLCSLSRAMNPGINSVLFKHGYKYTGRLISNCHICGGFEDMNIWVKKLKEL